MHSKVIMANYIQVTDDQYLLLTCHCPNFHSFKLLAIRKGIRIHKFTPISQTRTVSHKKDQQCNKPTIVTS